MSKTVQEEDTDEDNTSLVEEYAKIRSVLARISGLRLLMIDSAIIGGIVAFVVYFYEIIMQVAASNSEVGN
jgi:hypothetical protein